ncbi:MAG: hypothetical protein ACLVJ6_16845 [Merdibacter sp.]
MTAVVALGNGIISIADYQESDDVIGRIWIQKGSRSMLAACQYDVVSGNDAAVAITTGRGSVKNVGMMNEKG